MSHAIATRACLHLLAACAPSGVQGKSTASAGMQSQESMWDCSELTWKYLPHTRQAYTLTGLSDTEQHFSKSKSRFCSKAPRFSRQPALTRASQTVFYREQISMRKAVSHCFGADSNSAAAHRKQ